MEIIRLEELVKPFLTNGLKYVSHECDNLLPSGENYGSTIMKVEIKVLNDKNEEEIIHGVAKCPPPTEFLWEYFNTKVTFKKEIGVYNVIVPTINQFGKEKGIDDIFDFFAKPLGARISLNPESNVVDKDAVLLLENLKVQGYDLFERTQGFDLETSKVILKNLAVFHAASIAYKLAKPKEFKTTLMPFLSRDFEFMFTKSAIDSLKAPFREAASRNPECVPYLSKIDEAFENLYALREMQPAFREPFAGVIHQDLWTNNTMVKIVDGKPVQNKMMDFQLMEYNSPAHDLVFFLYLSVELTVLENETDNLIKYYYDVFVETLSKLNCDSSWFTFELLQKELAVVTKAREFSRILLVLKFIFLLKGQSKEAYGFSLNKLFIDLNIMHPNFFKRLQFMLLDFVRRGWI